MLKHLFLVLALLLPSPAAAQDAEALEGSWALQIGGATIFRFDLAHEDGAEEWQATWSRPSNFASDGDNFASLQLPARQIKSMAGLEFDGTVEVSFPDPRPEAVPDIFRFRLIDPDAAEMSYVGTGLAPYVLQRVARDTPLGPFEKDATYSRLVPAVKPAVAPKLEGEDDSQEVLESGETTPNANPNNFHLPPGR